MISCIGFALLAASTVVRPIGDFVSPVMGAGFVLMILFITYLPRRIRPGPTWFRARIPPTIATVVFSVAACTALAAVVGHASTNEPVWGWAPTAAIIVETLVVALTASARNRRASH